MDLLLVIYSEEIDKQMMAILKQTGVAGYTKWELVTGLGSSGAKLNNPIGPGSNKMLLMALEESTSKELLGRLKRIKESLLEKQGLKVIILPIKEVI